MSEETKPQQILQNRRMIFCASGIPAKCVHCDASLPSSDVVEMMMINSEGEAVVTPGPVVFCSGCEDVYAEENYYTDVAARFDFNPYSLVGFIDMSLLPEERREQPLGEDAEMNLPLVEFSALQALRPAKLD